MDVSSLNVSFCEPSHVVDTKRAGAMDRDRIFAGCAGLSAAITKTAGFSHVRAFAYVYDAPGDDMEYFESCWTSYLFHPRAVQSLVHYMHA